MRSAQNIFRSSGNNGETNQSSPTRCPSPATPTHRAIFRRPKQLYYPSAHSASSEESVIAALPRGPSWPPLTIPESESADTNRLGLSRPIRTGSSASRHDINASASSEREPRQKPAYYKIQMRNGMARLAAGDDNSVNIAEDHNDRIQLTPIRERKHRIIRASNITESSSLSGSPGRIGAEHQQTWEVVGNGQIVAVPAPATATATEPISGTPSSTGSSRHEKIASSTPNAPKKSLLRSMRTPATPPIKAHKKNDAPESPPRLAKASFDTISSGASSRSDNSFYNEMLDLAEPESPPHLDRKSCPDRVFSEDGSKVSKSSKSKSSRSERSESVDDSWSAGFVSQLIDFISIGPCCQMDSICRGRSRGGQVVS